LDICDISVHFFIISSLSFRAENKSGSLVTSRGWVEGLHRTESDEPHLGPKPLEVLLRAREKISISKMLLRVVRVEAVNE
jgi:hypothetical protein